MGTVRQARRRVALVIVMLPLLGASWLSTPAGAQTTSILTAQAAAAQAAAPVAAPAQSAPQQGSASQPPAASQVTAGFQDGFFIQTANGDNRLVFGFTGQFDGRFSIDDPLPITNTFVLRKVRPTLSGRVARYFDFKVMPDFGSGQTVMMDAYFDVRFSPRLRVRAGKDKTPVGYELLIGDPFVLFPERSLATNLVPNRDVGVSLQGDLSPQLFYAVGLFNGVPDGASSSADVDTNQGKDLAGRIVVQPFRGGAGAPAGALTGFGFQVGGSRGKQAGALPSFRTSVGQTYFTYAAGTAAEGTRTRISPAVFYYYKGFGGFAEFMRTNQRARRGDIVDEVVNRGWQVTGSYLLTGEAASERTVRPRSPFDPQAGTWGALQVLGRYTEVAFDRDTFVNGFAGAGAAKKATSFTAGVNWYPASVFKYYLTYERTAFEGGAAPARADENVILFRVQLGI